MWWEDRRSEDDFCSELELFERLGDTRAMVVHPWPPPWIKTDQCIADLRETLYVAVPCLVRSDVGV